VWLYLPTSTSVCSPEPPATTSPSESQFQELAASATWRGKSALPAFWRRAWRMGALSLLRSGVTCEPSHGNSIVAAWLDSLGAFPAPTCPSPGSESASKPESTLDSGSNTSGLFAYFASDGRLLKTSPQFSLFPTEESFSEGLPDSGLMRSGALYELPMSGFPTSGNGSSSSRSGRNWPAPRAEDAECCGNHPGATDSLGGAARGWNTPRTQDAKHQSATEWERRAGGGHGNLLHIQADRLMETWKTPHGMNGMDATGKYGCGGEFANQASNWTTPQSHDAGGGRPEASKADGYDARLR
jgi:hypothetical protein